MHYQITLRGQLDPSYAAWFGGLTLAHTPEGNTRLTGDLPDQAALHGVLTRCRDLGVTLISITPYVAQSTPNPRRLP
jgi:hypothetical protein